MKTAIELAFWLKFWSFTSRAMWRHVRGRWYVWRDAPTEVVRVAALLWFYARKKPATKGVTLIHEAYKEYRMRKARGQ